MVVTSTDFTMYVNSIAHECLPFRSKQSKMHGKALIDLPRKQSVDNIVNFDEHEREIYEAYAIEARLNFQEFTSSTASDEAQQAAYNRMMAGIIRLRQIYCDPRLVCLNKGASIPIPGSVEPLLSRLPDAPSSKTCQVLRTVQNSIRDDARTKILIFSKWTQHLRLVGDYLEAQGHRFFTYEGSMSNEDRKDVSGEFKSQSSVDTCSRWALELCVSPERKRAMSSLHDSLEPATKGLSRGPCPPDGSTQGCGGA